MKKTMCIISLIISFVMKTGDAVGLDPIDHAGKNELAAAWKIFLNAVSTHDMKTMKKVSFEKIRCLSCLENTGKEMKEMIEYQKTEPDWYKKLYEEKAYVPISEFCAHDYPIIFTREFIEKLQAREPVYGVEYYNNLRIYEVLIAASTSGELSPGDEGCLYVFQFVKEKNRLKFWGIDTIP